MSMNIHGGGAKTNINGLRFEQDTNLAEALVANGFVVADDGFVYCGETMVGLIASQHKFYSRFLEPLGINWKNFISKQMRPDEAFINEKDKTVYIIEKKFQNQAGSVDEKLQTCDFKKKQYEKLVRPLGYRIEYIYVCNDWFTQKQYKDVIEYIEECKCQIFFNEISLESLHLA